MTGFPSDDSITQRAKFLRSIADSLISQKVLSDRNVIFMDNKIQPLTEAYFLLNHAYKKWRIKKGHNTQPPKIAALTCMAIGTLQPFLPKDPNNASSLQQARCNEIYALACASTILGISLLKKKQDVYLRLLDVLSHCDCETIQPYLVDRKLGSAKVLSTYDFEIHKSDKLLLDSLITIFEMASLTK